MALLFPTVHTVYYLWEADSKAGLSQANRIDIVLLVIWDTLHKQYQKIT